MHPFKLGIYLCFVINTAIRLENLGPLVKINRRMFQNSVVATDWQSCMVAQHAFYRTTFKCNYTTYCMEIASRTP